MKRTLFSSLFLTSSLAFSAVPIDGWYAEIFGGYAYLPNNIQTTLNGLYWSNVNYTAGYNGGGRIGFKSNPLRYEAEVAYISATPNAFKVNYINQTNLSGQTSATTAMVNAYYDFPAIITPLEPFIGLGIGYAYVNAHLFGTGPTLSTEFRGTNSAFAYQGTVGLTYNFVDNYALDVEYRYLGTNNVSELGKMFQANFASAGVTYRFDGGSYK
ncbi:MAG: outer membrane beta-barrel protein [Gammaproteobacteria bacterium]|nr:outer membrane beta-barrel protein [Gammaproteobacteria bacterium]